MDNDIREYLRGEASAILEFAQTTGVRQDWHEPDEQDVTAYVSGDRLDNAGTRGEIVVAVDGPDAYVSVNLATLLAIAADYARIMETKNEV